MTIFKWTTAVAAAILFSASNGGKSFKVCCRHRTAGLGFVKSGLLHRYPRMRGNLSQVIGTPFQRLSQAAQVMAGSEVWAAAIKISKNFDFHPVGPMYHKSRPQMVCGTRSAPTDIGGPVESFTVPYESPQWYPGWGQTWPDKNYVGRWVGEISHSGLNQTARNKNSCQEPMCLTWTTDIFHRRGGNQIKGGEEDSANDP